MKKTAKHPTARALDLDEILEDVLRKTAEAHAAVLAERALDALRPGQALCWHEDGDPMNARDILARRSTDGAPEPGYDVAQGCWLSTPQARANAVYDWLRYGLSDAEILKRNDIGMHLATLDVDDDGSQR